ncbi:hypothetical protein BD289DRAFT_25069 [Coniella lustricola]|uniref:Uncharacterized protein n=1 Tax=Coniella lustricola TaxID=2025994 RepID=A0A2T3A3E5_9PEZI|nr:hypothetical protein BD289DRAFT_25069 [Coniella lustricola]
MVLLLLVAHVLALSPGRVLEVKVRRNGRLWPDTVHSPANNGSYSQRIILQSKLDYKRPPVSISNATMSGFIAPKCRRARVLRQQDIQPNRVLLHEHSHRHYNRNSLFSTHVASNRVLREGLLLVQGSVLGPVPFAKPCRKRFTIVWRFL